VRQLIASGIAPENLAYYGLEYKFTVEHLTGKITYSDMVARLNTAIHQFAKRQMTWFRGMERRGATIHWVDGALPSERLLERVQQLLAASLRTKQQ
jgi:tRNA dimethylallyltransferase